MLVQLFVSSGIAYVGLAWTLAKCRVVCADFYRGDIVSLRLQLASGLDILLAHVF